MKQILSTLVLVLSFSISAQAIDLKKCPTGRSGQAKATKANFMAALAKGTRWQNPGGNGEQQIVFVKAGTFKLDYQGSYKGQFKRAKREIVLGNDLGNTMFDGAMVVGGRLVVEMDRIYFTNINGKCALITNTNPDEYHASTLNYPKNDSRHHLLDDGKGNILSRRGKNILVLREYQWVSMQ